MEKYLARRAAMFDDPTPSREFTESHLMARKRTDPKEHGVPLEKEEFAEQIIGEFEKFLPRGLTVDEFLLRPRVALAFCDEIRLDNGWFDLPDDVILRQIMNYRKQAN
jgi:hypothetical protein